MIYFWIVLMKIQIQLLSKQTTKINILINTQKNKLTKPNSYFLYIIEKVKQQFKPFI